MCLFDTALVEHCAPTLAGVKPANLFRFRSQSLAQIRWDVSRGERALASRGIRVCILKECPSSNACMIYIYRWAWVERLLSEDRNRTFLEAAGYTPSGLPDMLNQLSGRLCLEQDYPHEIGLFLGYPLEDVVGFIENHGWNYTCCGYWKSYGDPEAAQKCFDRYRRCTEFYKRRYAQGTSILELVVAA